MATKSEGWMRRDRARIGAVAAVVVVASAVLIVGLGGLGRAAPSGSPAPTSSASSGPAAGPIAFYELVDAEASRLVARRLDGRSQPRVVVSREDVDRSPSWSVDPTATLAVVLTDVAGDPGHQDLVAYTIADGTQRWTARVLSTQPSAFRWARDGRTLAIVVDGDAAVGGRSLVLVDATSGAARSVRIPDDAWIVGVEPDGAGILYQGIDDSSSDRTAIRLLRVDPLTLTITQLRSLPDVGPTSDGGTLSISPAAGAAVSTASVEDKPGVEIRLRDLRTGMVSSIGSAASVDLLAIDPAGVGLAEAGAGTVRFLRFDGRAEDVFETDDTVTDLTWSSDGDRLLISTFGATSRLWVADPVMGRVLELPLPAVAEAHLLDLIGQDPVSADPVPALPSPTPTPAPSGGDVAGMPDLLSSWVETSTGRLVARARQLVPTESGGVRVAADMPAIDLGEAPAPGDLSTSVILVPRPASSEVLVWITNDEGSHGELWDRAAGTVLPAPLPPDWPTTASDPAWRPDGAALAASAGIIGLDGEFAGVFAIAELGATQTTIVPIVGEYDRLEGWWSADELQVGHGICTEGCAGRYSYSARLRIADHRLHQLTVADRGRRLLGLSSGDGRQVVWSLINEDPSGDLRIDWPAELGPEAVPLAVASDGTSAIVTREAGAVTELYRVRDVADRAVGGRLTDPDPIRIGAIPGRDLSLTIAPGEGWVVARNRVGAWALIRLADGRTWALDPDRQPTWVRPG